MTKNSINISVEKDELLLCSCIYELLKLVLLSSRLNKTTRYSVNRKHLISVVYHFLQQKNKKTRGHTSGHFFIFYQEPELPPPPVDPPPPENPPKPPPELPLLPPKPPPPKNPPNPPPKSSSS